MTKAAGFTYKTRIIPAEAAPAAPRFIIGKWDRATGDFLGQRTGFASMQAAAAAAARLNAAAKLYHTGIDYIATAL
jgi:hypothetical protein